MSPARRGGSSRKAALLCLGIYALVLLVGPVLHHDLECHLQSPGHCQACVASPLAPDVAPDGGLGSARLVASGRALPLLGERMRSVPLALLAGRAPPR